MLGIFDSHAHYDDKAFDEDRDELLEGMKAAGIEMIVNVGSSIETVKKTLEITGKYPFIYGSAGIHPEECADTTDEDIDWIESVCADSKIVAVGETGLDYHYDEPDRETQKKWFKRQLELAAGVGKPVIIHSRDAAEDTMTILKEYTDRIREGIGGNDAVPGVLHCFSNSAEMALEYVKMGYYIGVGGVVTFKNAKKLTEVVEKIPIERIVVETDCPYMTPEPHRGKRNDSMYLNYVVDKIAEIKGMDCSDVISITGDNALRMYIIKE